MKQTIIQIIPESIIIIYFRLYFDFYYSKQNLEFCQTNQKLNYLLIDKQKEYNKKKKSFIIFKNKFFTYYMKDIPKNIPCTWEIDFNKNMLILEYYTKEEEK